MKTSVLIPTYHRGEKLRTCLMSLARQTVLPGEVIVAWQGDDTASRDLAESCIADVGYPLRVVHAPQGIVPAENFVLDAAGGEIIFLIDDDAIAPVDWMAKHLAFYEKNPRCGAVGGPAINFDYGRPLPRRAAEPVGKILWYGKHIGNMYDHIDEWRTRPPLRVDHLVGYNMCFRRLAVDRFEDALKPYWQLFEMDACMQITRAGWEIWFDFSNIVEHHPTSTAYHPERDSNLQVKIYNFSYNEAYVLSKFSPWHLRLPQLGYMLIFGITRAPGVLGMVYAMYKFGNPKKELRIWWNTLKNRLSGWRDGKAARRKVRPRTTTPTAETATIATRS